MAPLGERHREGRDDCIEPDPDTGWRRLRRRWGENTVKAVSIALIPTLTPGGSGCDARENTP